LLKRWNKISEEIINRNSHWTYKLDKFEIEPNGKGEYHYVHTNGSTLIIPILPSKKILLVNQFRYLIQKEALEFSCGVLEENLTIHENAQKELREETGYEAKNLELVASFVPYSGVSNEICYVFVAWNLKNNPLKPDENEEFELLEYSFEEIENLIENNVLTDGMTLAAWSLSKKKIIEIIANL